MPSTNSHAPAPKSNGGLARIFSASKHSWQGLVAAAKNEQAFRQELMAVIPLSIGTWFVPVPPLQRALLFSVLQIILIAELLNSAIEANTDHISLELHPLAKRAKDMGSAAVLLSIILSAAVWGAVLWQRYAPPQ